MAGSPAQASSPAGGRLNLWPLALVALILGFALFGERGVLHMFKLSAQKDEIAQALAVTQQQNDVLRGEIAALHSDRKAIERIARTELGMVRDDELIFQFSGKN